MASQVPFVSTDGLEKLQKISLECVPEMNAVVFARLLEGSKNAANLTSLELRFCDLRDYVISQLLYHIPPNVKQLVVILGRQSQYEYRDHAESPPHLCPLLRKLGKGLPHLEFGA